MKRPEEIKQEIVKGWLRKADQDLAPAEALLSRTPPLLSPSCFHCQQAVEKYLKAFLTLHQVEYPKTHDIVELLDLLGKVDGKLAASLEDIVFLNPYGVGVRYPGDIPDPDLSEAKEAYSRARRTREELHPFLPFDSD